ncbi:MAG: hypothetical protein KGJ90_07400, partial [Patescibacteria group bacterium]|nr:hypothetical protein [Patescibacteria group bacterium]
MRRLGARPEETINNFVNDWVDKLNESDPVKAKALSERFNSEMGNTWKLLTGTVGHPSDSFVRRLEASARHTIGVAKTGLSVTSLPTDMVLRASQMADYSGGRLQDSVLSQMKQFTDAAANLSKDDKQWLMAQMGSRWENALRPIDPHLIDHPGFGAVYKFNGHIANSLGHSYWDNTFRAGNLANDANIFAREQHLPFSKVSYMEGLQRFGIGEKEWNVLREVETQKLSDGRPALVPETILETPLEKFRQMVSIKDPSDSLLRRARADLAGKYRNILGELADRATSATSLENQAALHLGEINPNSPYSTVMRWALQLKGWGLNYIRNHLDRELRGHYTNYVSVGQALRDMALGRNNSGLVGLSRLIAKGMVVAYITNSLRQMAMGQTPLNPFDFDSEKYNGFLNTPGAQAAAGAFAKQGLGLYSDWILAQGAPDEKI